MIRPVEDMLQERAYERVEALMEDWREEASGYAVANMPRRAWYLEYMADRAHQIYADGIRRRSRGEHERARLTR